jgi:hypothetical protein
MTSFRRPTIAERVPESAVENSVEGGAGHRITGQRRQYAAKTDGAGLRRRLVVCEVVLVATDGYSRLGYAEVLTDQKGPTTVGFVRHRHRT